MVYSDAHRQELEQLLAVSIGPACHELRSPLAVVYGFSRMLEVSEQADPAHIQHILQGSSRLDELLDQLATMGRIAACRTVPDVRDHAFDPILADVVADTRAGERLSVAGACEQLVHVDRDWTIAAIAEAIDGLCYDPEMRVQVSPQAVSGGVRLVFTVDGSLPLPERGVGHSSLRIALSRMRVMAMGGALHERDFGLEMDLPSRSG